MNSPPTLNRSPAGLGRQLPGRHWLYGREADVLAVLVPALMAYSFGTGFGRAYPADLLLIMMLPVVVAHRWLLQRDRVIRYFLAAGTAWLIGVMIADLLAGSPLPSIVRGWGEVVLTLLAIGALGILVAPQPSRIFSVFGGVALGLALHVFVWPDDSAVDQPWRLGGLTALVVAVLVVSRLRSPSRGRVYYATLFGAMSVVAFLLESRNTGLILGAACGLSLATWAMEKRRFAGRNRKLILVVLTVSLPILMLFAYSYLAREGYLGPVQQAKYEFQSTGDFGVILGARGDVVGALLAIRERPFTGHGSRPEDAVLIEDFVETMYRLGYQRSLPDGDSIPAHSGVLGTWAAGGILSLPFWLGILAVAFVSVIRSYSLDPGLQAFVVFIGLGTMWSALFSPFGGRARVELAAAVVLFAVSYLIESRDGERSSASRFS